MVRNKLPLFCAMIGFMCLLYLGVRTRLPDATTTSPNDSKEKVQVNPDIGPVNPLPASVSHQDKEPAPRLEDSPSPPGHVDQGTVIGNNEHKDLHMNDKKALDLLEELEGHEPHALISKNNALDLDPLTAKLFAGVYKGEVVPANGGQFSRYRPSQTTSAMFRLEFTLESGKIVGTHEFLTVSPESGRLNGVKGRGYIGDKLFSAHHDSNESPMLIFTDGTKDPIYYQLIVRDNGETMLGNLYERVDDHRLVVIGHVFMQRQ